MDVASLSFLVVWVWDTLPISYIRSLTIFSLTCWYDNFEPQAARMVKLFRMVGFERWENTSFAHVQGRLLVEWEIIMWSDVSPYPMCLLWSSAIAGFRSFCANHIISSLLVYSACLSVCLHFACLSTPLLLSYPSPKSLCHPTSVLFSIQNSYTSLFCLVEESHSSLSQYVNHQMTPTAVSLFQCINHQMIPIAVCLSM